MQFNLKENYVKYSGFFRNILHKIPQFFRNIKWAYQRAKNGFCDIDRMDLCYYLEYLIPKILHDFASKTQTYPLFGNYNSESENDEYQVWVDKINSVATLFDECNPEHESNKNKYEEEYEKYFSTSDFSSEPSAEFVALRDKYFKESERLSKNLKSKRLKALKALHEIWDDLID